MGAYATVSSVLLSALYNMYKYQVALGQQTREFSQELWALSQNRTFTEANSISHEQLAQSASWAATDATMNDYLIASTLMIGVYGSFKLPDVAGYIAGSVKRLGNAILCRKTDSTTQSATINKASEERKKVFEAAQSIAIDLIEKIGGNLPDNEKKAIARQLLIALKRDITDHADMLKKQPV